jgi:hypothetical protein
MKPGRRALAARASSQAPLTLGITRLVSSRFLSPIAIYLVSFEAQDAYSRRREGRGQIFATPLPGGVE